jgi:hypothetical protein
LPECGELRTKGNVWRAGMTTSKAGLPAKAVGMSVEGIEASGALVGVPPMEAMLPTNAPACPHIQTPAFRPLFTRSLLG